MALLSLPVCATEKTQRRSLRAEGRRCKMDQETRWLTRYDEVVAFIEREHRNPSRYDDTERGLYVNWLRHQRKLYNSGEMKEERRMQFEKLLEMTERVKRKNQWV